MRDKKYGQLLEVSDVDSQRFCSIVNENKLFLLCGPSGVGKSTIIKSLFSLDNRFVKIVRITTKRKPISEKDTGYRYVSSEEFSKLLSFGELFEVGRFGPGLYGTEYRALEDAYSVGEIALFDADIETSLFIKEIGRENGKNVVIIFITPTKMGRKPSILEINEALTILKRRILNRNRGESKEDIAGRLKGAKSMFRVMHKADYIISNNQCDLKSTIKMLLKLINHSI